MSAEDGRFDGIFMQICQQGQGIDAFFETAFSFLRRKTDFFANQKGAEEIIVKHCQVQFKKFQESKTTEEKEQMVKKQKEEELKKKKQADELKKAQEKKVEPVQKKEQPVKQEVQTVDNVKKEDENAEKKDEEEDKTPPPKGNGGTTEKYVWTQTLEEVQVYIPIENNLKAKDFEVKMLQSTLQIKEKGKEPLINGEYYEKINIDDSLWTIETQEGQKVIHLTLSKWKNQWHWWDSVIKGDPKINTQKINPEASNLSDLDGETRGTVEKMMFDMRQKQMGKPTSDELSKQDMLGNFMKQHPEMDFSKCKFN